MSLGIIIKAPEGLVLAAESRITLTAQLPNRSTIPVHFDNASKLFEFKNGGHNIGVVTYGHAGIGARTVQGYTPEFEASLGDLRISVPDFAKKLSEFFLEQWNANMPPQTSNFNMTFLVAGFDENAPFGRVFQIDIPSRPAPIEMNPDTQFGITWGGQREFVDRLVKGYDDRLIPAIINALSLNEEQKTILMQNIGHFVMSLPLGVMPLQDCIDLAIFFIRTTIMAQRLTVGIRGCGGAIDVATITRRDGFNFISKKTLKAESKDGAIN